MALNKKGTADEVCGFRMNLGSGTPSVTDRFCTGAHAPRITMWFAQGSAPITPLVWS